MAEKGAFCYQNGAKTRRNATWKQGVFLLNLMFDNRGKAPFVDLLNNV